MNQSKPEIVIMACQTSKEILKEILAGIEEEQLFYKVIWMERQMDVQQLATEAAKQSSLDVGIGVFQRNVVVTCRQLEGKQPLLKGDNGYRRLGINAARYIKKNPFV
ncbi:MAG: Dehydratase medium subunit [Clostridiales bacterium]|jgi:hypothetical protein|nr:Dehydratase medium subunit [Clostridiales bacterium]MDK2933689.1 Dehydratase medium subunit [Clostridiales bacterium]